MTFEMIFGVVFWTLLWIGYGAFSAYQISEIEKRHEVLTYLLYVLVAPLILLIRILIGILSRRTLGG